MRLGAGGASLSIVCCSWSVVRSVVGCWLSAPTYPPCEQWLTVAGVGAVVDGWWVVVGWVLVAVLLLVIIHWSSLFIHHCHSFVSGSSVGICL
jgi:hypothetical protein